MLPSVSAGFVCSAKKLRASRFCAASSPGQITSRSDLSPANGGGGVDETSIGVVAGAI
jgi:hypothetical protein